MQPEAAARAAIKIDEIKSEPSDLNSQFDELLNSINQVESHKNTLSESKEVSEYSTVLASLELEALELIKAKIKAEEKFTPDQVKWITTHDALCKILIGFLKSDYIPWQGLSWNVASYPFSLKHPDAPVTYLARLEYCVRELGALIPNNFNEYQWLALFRREPIPGWPEERKTALLNLAIAQLQTGSSPVSTFELCCRELPTNDREYRYSLIHFAAHTKIMGFFDWLASQPELVNPVSPNYVLNRRENDTSLLGRAAANHDLEMVRFLITHGCNVRNLSSNYTVFDNVFLTYTPAIHELYELGTYLLVCGSEYRINQYHRYYTECVKAAVEFIIEKIKRSEAFPSYEKGWMQVNTEVRARVVSYINDFYLTLNDVQQNLNSSDEKETETATMLHSAINKRVAYVVDLGYTTQTCCAIVLRNLLRDSSALSHLVLQDLLQHGFHLSNAQYESMSASMKARYEHALVICLITLYQKLSSSQEELTSAEINLLQQEYVQALLLHYLAFTQMYEHFTEGGIYQDVIGLLPAGKPDEPRLMVVFDVFNELFERVRKQQLLPTEQASHRLTREQAVVELSRLAKNKLAAQFLHQPFEEKPALDLLEAHVPCKMTLAVTATLCFQFDSEKPLLFHLCFHSQSVNILDRFFTEDITYLERLRLSNMSFLLCAGDTLNDRKDLEFFTPLTLAVIAGNKPLVRFFIQQGAKLNPEVIKPPLYWACVKQDKEMIELLLRHGANPHFKCDPPLSPQQQSFVQKASERLPEFLLHGLINQSLTPQQQKLTQDPRYTPAMRDYLLKVCLTLPDEKSLPSQQQLNEQDQRLTRLEEAIAETTTDTTFNMKSPLCQFLISDGKSYNAVKSQDEKTSPHPIIALVQQKRFELRRLQAQLTAPQLLRQLFMGESPEFNDEQRAAMREYLLKEFLTLPPKASRTQTLIFLHQRRLEKLATAMEEGDADYANKSPLAKFLTTNPCAQTTIHTGKDSPIHTNPDSFLKDLRELLRTKQKELKNLQEPLKNIELEDFSTEKPRPQP